MELGWIDFSKTERKKVLQVLDLLGEDGILDELGIAPIRDYFSNLFFPGISTVQTRAKYFLIIPYIFKDLECSNQSDSRTPKQRLNDAERECAIKLLDNNPEATGIIGKIAINNGKWVNRTPAKIYWSGLWKYRLIQNEHLAENVHMSIDDSICNKDINLNIETYTEDWDKNLDIKLTSEEGEFLKNKIMTTCGDNMIGIILSDEKNFFNVFDCKDFYELRHVIKNFPEHIKNDYYKALYFSEFVFALRVVYNVVISGGQNEEANDWLDKLNFREISKIDVEDLFVSSGINNPKLKKFLTKSKCLMENNEIEELKECVKLHEISLKKNKAKSLHPGEFDCEMWYGGRVLDYRFQNAKRILKDICESKNQSTEVNKDVKS